MFISDRELESYQRARDYIIIVFHDRRYHYYRRSASPCSTSIAETVNSFESVPVLKLIFVSVHEISLNLI